MCSTPRDGDLEAPCALPARLHGTALGGTLADQHGAARHRALFDEGPGGSRADFLVGRHQDLDAGPILQLGQAVDGLHQPAEHVEDAGAGDAPIGDPEGPALEGAEREHRVVVPEDQDLGGRHRQTSARAARLRSRQ